MTKNKKQKNIHFIIAPLDGSIDEVGLSGPFVLFCTDGWFEDGTWNSQWDYICDGFNAAISRMKSSIFDKYRGKDIQLEILNNPPLVEYDFDRLSDES